MLNINKMCASDTPRVYKQGKKEVHNFSWNVAAQKCVKIYKQLS